MGGHDALSRVATHGDTYCTGTDVSETSFPALSPVGPPATHPAVVPAASPVPWRERDGAAAAETDMRWAVARFAASPRTPKRNPALSTTTTTTRNSAATNQAARRGSPRQPADKAVCATREEDPQPSFDSPARGSPRQPARKAFCAAREGDSRESLESPGRRAARGGASSQQCGGEREKGDVRRSSDSHTSIATPAVEAARKVSSQQCGGARRKERRSFDSCDLLKTPAVEAAVGSSLLRILKSERRKERRKERTEERTEEGTEERTEERTEEGTEERTGERGSLDLCDLLTTPAVVAAGSLSLQASCGGKEREKKGGLTNKLLKEQKKGEFYEGASPGKGRPAVVGSVARAKERETKELTDKLLTELFERARSDIEGALSGIEAAPSGKVSPPAVSSARARERGKKELTDMLLKEAFEKAPSGIEGAPSGKGRPPTAGSGTRAQGRRSSIGSLAELRQLARPEHGDLMTPHGQLMREHERQQHKEQAKSGNSGPLRASPSARGNHRRSRSTGEDDAPFESTQQAQQSSRKASPSAHARHRRNRSTGDDAAPFELIQQRQQFSRKASPSAHAVHRRNRSVGDDAAPLDAAPLDAALAVRPKSRLRNGNAPAASHVLPLPQCFSPNAAPPGRLALSLKALVGRLTFARPRGDGSRGGERRAGGNGGGNSGGSGSGGGGSKAGGFKEAPTATHELQRGGRLSGQAVSDQPALADQTELASQTELAGQTRLAGQMKLAGQTELAGETKLAGQMELAGKLENAGWRDTAGGRHGRGWGGLQQMQQRSQHNGDADLYQQAYQQVCQPEAYQPEVQAEPEAYLPQAAAQAYAPWHVEKEVEWDESGCEGVFRFCRSKCHRNFKLKRNPRKVRWTKAYRRLHGKDLASDTAFEMERLRNRPERYNRSVDTTFEMERRRNRPERYDRNMDTTFEMERRRNRPERYDRNVDTTFEMERRRNRPERYDRNVVATTVAAMKRIDELRVKRQAKFWEKRMKVKTKEERRQARQELETGIHLVKAPAALAADPSLTLPKPLSTLSASVAEQAAKEKAIAVAMEEGEEVGGERAAAEAKVERAVERKLKGKMKVKVGRVRGAVMDADMEG
ncbi:unnamed protein product [Closterium sp. NIES-64]|nr:unnamed protein product [Closterium sp. NIES-64]